MLLRQPPPPAVLTLRLAIHHYSRSNYVRCSSSNRFVYRDGDSAADLLVDLPDFGEHFRCDVGRRSADGVQRFVDDRRQSEITQFQRLAAVGQILNLVYQHTAPTIVG